MKTPTNGGPVYPLMAGNESSGIWREHDGMSLRDYFAGQALVGLIASNDEGAGDRIIEVPEYAYAIADAMLAARLKGGVS